MESVLTRDAVTWPPLRSVREVHEFIGLTSYYRKFLANFAKVARPLTDLLNGKLSKYEWIGEANGAFEALKAALASPPILAMPTYDGLFVLDTDVSLYSIGAVLAQVQDGMERVIAYASRRMHPAEVNYSTS